MSEMPSASDEAGMKPRRQKNAGDLDRLPPYSGEAEMGVISCCLQAPADGVGMCVARFKGKPDVFYDLRHQTVFAVLREMYEANEGIDLITVAERLRKRGVLSDVGSEVYLVELQGSAASVAMLPEYLRIVMDQYRLRRLGAICAKAQAGLYSCDGDVPTFLTQVEADMSKLTEDETEASEEHIKTVMQRVLVDLEENRYIRGKTQLRGLPTGEPCNYLDKLVRGIRPTFYYVIAGRPGEGKTSKAMNMVEFLANDYVWQEKTGVMLRNQESGEEYPEMVSRKGIPVCVFSIEMDGDSLVSRMLFGRAGVDTAEFMQGFAEKQEDFQTRLAKAASELAKSKIYIDASPAQTMGQIAAKARRMVKQYGIKLFVLDYLQLVEGEDDGRKTDRVKELNQISRKIMALKKQLKVPWIVLCQMNRNIETSEAKRDPQLSDLKDSGAIMVWTAVAADGTKYTFKEWPGEDIGEWAVPGTKMDGAIGPAQTAGGGMGFNDYKRLILEQEGWVIGEEGMWVPGENWFEVFERDMDPRPAGTSVPSDEDSRTYLDHMSEPLRDAAGKPLMREALDFQAGPDCGIEEGKGWVNNWINDGWNANKPVDPLNCPKWYVSSRCVNVIWALKTYTGVDGLKGACKDPIDCIKGQSKRGIRYMPKGALGSYGGGQAY